MSQWLGHDFSRVRIHHDAEAAASAAYYAADAYTYRRHIVFAAGRYQPGSRAGQRLLAHELTHVIQADHGGSAGTGVSSPGDASEREASRVAGSAGDRDHVRVSGSPSSAVQRQVSGDQPAADPAEPLTERLARATRALKAPDFEDAIWERYHTSSAGATEEVVDGLWRGELSLGDVDPSGAGLPRNDSMALRKFEKALADRVTRVLVSKLAKLAEQVPASTDKIAGELEGTFTSPDLNDNDAANRLFAAWVRPGKISGGPLAAEEKKVWNALKAASGSPAVGKRLIGQPDAAKVSQVKAVLDPASTWVVSLEDTDALADKVAGATGQPIAHADPDWRKLRSAMPGLIIAAEAELINETIPESKVRPETWVLLRHKYVATITKPLWTFFRDDIESATIFGAKADKSKGNQGVHKDVKAAIPRVEESAMRLGRFKTKGDVNALVGKLIGSEFRFTVMTNPDWIASHPHASFHDTGRAIDFRNNPDFRGPAHDLISMLGDQTMIELLGLLFTVFDPATGIKLSELSQGSVQQRADLQKVAARKADIDQRARLQDQLKATASDADKAALQGEIDRLNARLAGEASADALAKTVRERAVQSYRDVKDVEARLAATWARIPDSFKDPKNASSLVGSMAKQLTAKIGSAMADVDKARAAYTDAKAAQEKVTAAGRAKTQADPALTDKARHLKDAEAQRVAAEQRLKNLQDAQKRLDSLKKQPGSMASVVGSVGKFARSGLTTMPSWLVEAFAEQGWQWGFWPEFADPMHFDYMGPVADVRPEAQLW
jgi:hypothetical protein